MAVLTRVNMIETGATVTGTAAAGGGDTADNSDGKTVLVVNNGSGGSLTVTVTVQNASQTDAVLGLVTKTSVARAVAAGARECIGPFPPSIYNLAGSLQITYSGVTSLSICAVKLP